LSSAAAGPLSSHAPGRPTDGLPVEPRNRLLAILGVYR
jgi:hypothetical protein